MSDGVDLQFVLARLDRIQKELGMMRLREEQREASHQAITQTLSRQMVEAAGQLEELLAGFEARLDERLDRIEARLAGVEDALRLAR